MTTPGADVFPIPAPLPRPPDAEPAAPSLDLVEHALQCVRQALASVEQVARTLSVGDGRERAEPRAAVAARPDGSAHEPWLTRQERRVLTLVAAGLSNREIAGVLEISEKTAKNYVHTVLVKLDAGSRTEAAFTALYENLVDLDECRRASKRSSASWLVPPQRSRPLP
ncbi:helix-turn-helix domain-containing protein [Saccharothrix australiensis]|uniref:Regulatory LuxR family protein n=1 Tax=Saccharothrix australiensis TaxID=2072 RepID=A0A495VZ70_9PSEU|nr:helix-turn-helix transcriptional regulator [Saccharothrix australiensis]RKT54509.1 regulatory LuxR family protein [Saccharothrix australiensis]